MRQSRRLLRGDGAMRTIFLAALVLSTAMATAEVYRCPQTYPDKDAPADGLTGAYMMWGERPSSGPPFPSGWVTPREETAVDGLDLHYELPEDEQSWLICQYGARKRVKGKLHDGREWGQHMEAAKHPWFLKVSPKVAECTVQVREMKSPTASKSTWTATATCKPLSSG